MKSGNERKTNKGNLKLLIVLAAVVVVAVAYF